MLRTLLAAGHAGATFASWARLAAAARDPRRAQLALLRAHLRANAGTAYGRAHGFSALDSPAAFQRAVPIADYDAFEPWIARIAAGEPNVLTREPVRMMERSGGSTATNKLIPYTDGLLRQFAAGNDAWIFSLYAGNLALAGSRFYLSVSPAARQREHTAGGLPIGFEDDTEYLGPVARWAVQKMVAVPGTVARLPDVESWRLTTLRGLLAAGDLGLFSVWSPTFLTLLMEHLAERFEPLVAELPRARRRAILGGVARAGGIVGEALWPRLRLISCWTDGTAAGFVPALRRWFPRTTIAAKGLLATEGVVSVPLSSEDGAGGVAALTSHFLEFVDLQAPAGTAPLLAHELRQGGEYSPLLTTAGGLVRYHLKDVVRCLGHWQAAPRLRFVGKLDRASDVAGEKLTEPQVAAALAGHGPAKVDYTFALLAPDLRAQPRYVLYVDSTAQAAALAALGESVERHLLTGHHYRYCRDLGQLGPLVVMRVRGGWARYSEALTARGARAGDIKPAHLDARPFWAEIFADGEPAAA
jgi:hypothetical protein